MLCVKRGSSGIISNMDAWEVNSKLVLHEIERLNRSVNKMEHELHAFRDETRLAIQALQLQNKFKQSIYGLIGGGGGYSLVALLQAYFNKG